MLMIISLIFCTHDIFFSFVYFVVDIVYFVVHIVCEVDVIANSLVLYLDNGHRIMNYILAFIPTFVQFLTTLHHRLLFGTTARTWTLQRRCMYSCREPLSEVSIVCSAGPEVHRMTPLDAGRIDRSITARRYRVMLCNRTIK